MYSHGLRSCGLPSHGLYSYGDEESQEGRPLRPFERTNTVMALNSYGMYNYGLHNYGLPSLGLPV